MHDAATGTYKSGMSVSDKGNKLGHVHDENKLGHIRDEIKLGNACQWNMIGYVSKENKLGMVRDDYKVGNSLNRLATNECGWPLRSGINGLSLWSH